MENKALILFQFVFSLMMILVGIMHFISDKNNNVRKLFGSSLAITGVIIASEIINVYKYYQNMGDFPIRTLDIQLMLKWFFVVMLFTIYPIFSLAPRYLTRKNLLLLFTPFFVVAYTAICFEFFDGTITPVHSFTDFMDKLHYKDVIFRGVIVAVTTITSLCYTHIAYYNFVTTKRAMITRGIYSYVVFGYVIPFVYIGFIFGTRATELLFMLMIDLFFLSNAISFFYYDMPLISKHKIDLAQKAEIADKRILKDQVLLRRGRISKSVEVPEESVEALREHFTEVNELTQSQPNQNVVQQEEQIIEVDNSKEEVDIKSKSSKFAAQSASLKIYSDTLDRVMKRKKSFTNPDLSVEMMAELINTNRIHLIQIVKSKGFASCHDYLGRLRIDYFKYLARKNPTSSVGELFPLCGFSSRATFYRNFAEYESITPTEFLAQALEEYNGKSASTDTSEELREDNVEEVVSQVETPRVAEV